MWHDLFCSGAGGSKGVAWRRLCHSGDGGGLVVFGLVCACAGESVSGAGVCAGRSCGDCPVGGYSGLIVVGLEGSGGYCRRGCGGWVPMDGGAGLGFAGFSEGSHERWIVSRW